MMTNLSLSVVPLPKCLFLQPLGLESWVGVHLPGVGRAQADELRLYNCIINDIFWIQYYSAQGVWVYSFPCVCEKVNTSRTEVWALLCVADSIVPPCPWSCSYGAVPGNWAESKCQLPQVWDERLQLFPVYSGVVLTLGVAQVNGKLWSCTVVATVPALQVWLATLWLAWKTQQSSET